ncbi:MAG: hypothetical protein RIR79_1883 [Pseudomonadota bacterium]|jgi:diguanylate cyclase (GGDEF)-like protein
MKSDIRAVSRLTQEKLESLTKGLARGLESHVNWTHRLLRCCLLQESPGEETFLPNAHELCRFGIWFARTHSDLALIDAAITQQIAISHEGMHLAVRTMCTNVLTGRPTSPSELEDYEYNQSTMVSLLHAMQQKIAGISMRHDALTGLPLRHGLEYAYELRSNDSVRTGQTLWLVMIDLDKFKSVNDNYGHAVGDMALRHVSEIMSSHLRQNDVLIRFGGEEFLALFMIPKNDSIITVIERLLEAVRTTPLHTPNHLILTLTATAGVARVRLHEALGNAVERADYALLKGKTFGRDQYVMASDLE